MSVRIGIDLVSVDSIRDSISRFGERYLRRVFSVRELADCQTSAGYGDRYDDGLGGQRRAPTVSAARLAARFAAKEAAFKALRVGGEAVSWTDVEVLIDALGGVDLVLGGNTAVLARREGMIGFTVSLTHDRNLATAVVIAEIGRVADS